MRENERRYFHRKPHLKKNMKSKFAAIHIALSLCASLLPAGAASATLPIRNRIQWLENNGYCGETSLQECALYFGIYASQFCIRDLIDPTQQNDLVELEEWARVLDALGLKAVVFPTDRVAAPQYKVFEVWAKQQLARRHPVIATCYFFNGTPPADDPVDHIVTLTSFTAANLTAYSPDDAFVFNHHIPRTTEGLPGAPAAFAQRAKWLFDLRSMTGPGAIYGYAIQKEVNYALAIAGTTNESPFARPVRVELDRIGEPNVIAGEEPALLAAEIKIESLTPGVTYVLYRYNDPATVPAAHYAARPSDSKVVFKATASTHTLTDAIPSKSVAIFRCLPAGR